MRLSLRGITLSCGLMWGGVVLLCALASVYWQGYSKEFLGLVASIYPGFKANGTVVDALVGGAYGLVDGAVGGLIFGLLYNLFAGRKAAA